MEDPFLYLITDSPVLYFKIKNLSPKTSSVIKDELLSVGLVLALFQNLKKYFDII